MIGNEVFALFEGDAKQLVCCEENAVKQNALELEVWLEQLCVDVVFLGANLLGVEIPIPRLHLEVSSRCLDCGLNIFGFEFCIAPCCRSNFAQHFMHVCWVLCGAVGEHVVRV